MKRKIAVRDPTGPDPLSPTVRLLCKLGSFVVHLEEINTPGGNFYDAAAIDALLADPELREWIKAMQKLALVPVKR